NMPMLQLSLASFRTSAAPNPGPTPATIATHFFFASAINVWIAGAMLLSRAKGVGTPRRAASTSQSDLIIGQVFLPVATHARGFRRLAIATPADHEMARQKVCPA